MSWLAVKLWLAKAWSFTKQHWQLPFLAMWSVAVWMLTRRNSQAVIDVLNAKKESYDKQISILKQKHNEEILKRDQKTYYKISLFVGFSDRDLIEGVFTVPGKTKALTDVAVNGDVISVDLSLIHI